MSVDYEAICRRNIGKYGTETKHLSYFSDIYSTRTHFIFEVLQNAEDALSRRSGSNPDAGYVDFRLFSDRLEIRHNGAPFTEKDVDGICGIGESTKASDYTQIGKFGIGFKSVYAYTFFPQIHSGGEYFEIQRFVEPHAVAQVTDEDTLIILPFDQTTTRPEWAFREDVSASDAVREIGEAIRKLGIRTLLFLQNIEEIKWTMPDGVSGHFIRNCESIPGKENLSKVEVLDQNDQFEEWRIFSRKVDVPDAGQPQQVSVKIAYLVKDGKIVKATDTELVVFFPTEKKTELGFLIQAPFKATKARDNIKSDDSANRQMIEAAAQLAADSLENLRDLGLLNVDSYAALPLRAREFSEDSPFRPVDDKVREALKTKALLPAHGGSYVCASQAKLACDKDLVKLFSSEQLDTLLNRTGLRWLDEFITESETTTDLHSFLKDVVEEIRPDKLKDKLTAPFFAAQSEEWLCNFYAYLKKGQNYGLFSSAPFVRREGGQHVSPGSLDKPNIWLPPANAADIDQTIFPLVKRSLASNPEIGKFLRETAKLREPDKVDVVIQCMLRKYAGAALPFNQDDYVRDLKEISRAHSNSNSKPDDANRLVTKLKDALFVAAVPAGNSQSGTVVWKKPGDQALYRQSPGLEQWFAGNETDGAWFPLFVVGENLPDDLKSKLGFANATLVKRSPPNLYRRPEGGFDKDANIFGLQWAVSHPTRGRAIFLWDKLLEDMALIKGKELRSRNRTFPADSTWDVSGYSTLGDLCAKHPWLPWQDAFCRPAELLLSELPDDFEKGTPRAESLSRALGMKQREREQALDLVTGGDETLRRLINQYQNGTDSDREKLSKMIPTVLPPTPAPSFKEGLGSLTRSQRGNVSPRTDGCNLNVPASNPARYQDKLNEATSDAVKRHHETPQSIQFSPVRERPENKEARAFLYQEYQGCCQLSGNTFQKAKPDADGNILNYFEVFSLLPYSNAEYLNDAGNMLVSADMGARLGNASFEWLDDIQGIIDQFRQANGSLEKISIRVRLANEDAIITWSQRHFMRLIALYEKS